MKRKILKQATAVTVASAMVLAGYTSILAENETDHQVVDKDETVYVTADAKGNPTKTTVQVTLKNPGGSSDIADVSTLTDIKNKEGDEEYTQKDDGTLIWENHGEDIQYEGTTDQSVPLSVKVSYYLDGKEMEPEEIAGKSGRVKIRFDYENHTTEAVKVDGETVAVPVPFLVFSTAFLSEDVFSDIEVNNGKIISVGGNTVALGYALPGVSDSLKLEEYEPTEDMELPEYVEITAQAERFELDFTATVVTGGLFSQLEDKDFDDMEELTDSMEELSEASGELVEGTGELYDGIETFAGYMAEYMSGVEALAGGTSQLTAGIRTLNENKGAIKDGAASLQAGLEGINEALASVSIPTGDSDMTELMTAAGIFMQDTVGVATQLSSLNEFLTEVETVNGEIAAAVADLEGISQEDWQVAAVNPAYESVKNYLDNSSLEQGAKEELLALIPQTITADAMTSAAYGKVAAVSEKLNSLSITVPDLSSLNALIADMETQMQILSSHSEELSGMGDQLETLSGYVEELKSGISQLAAGSAQLTEGIEAFHQGIDQLYGGSVALGSGAAALVSAGGAMGQAVGVLSEGMLTLKDGFAEFDEEGIQKLTDLAGEDLHDFMIRMKALKQADEDYDNFSGIRKGQTGSVRFIVETKAVDSDQDES